MPSSWVGCMDINLCQPKIKFEEKKGLRVIKKILCVVITSSVRGIFLVFYLFFYWTATGQLILTERSLSGQIVEYIYRIYADLMRTFITKFRLQNRGEH